MARGALGIVQKYFPKVTKVNDASESVMVEVTARDNAHSKVRDHSACAMAVACKRTFKVDGVIVSIHMAYLVEGNTATRYQLPESISREIVSVDREAPMGFDVGIYKLNKPVKGKEIGSWNTTRKAGGGKKKGLQKPIVFRHRTNGIRAALGSRIAPDGITRTHG